MKRKHKKKPHVYNLRNDNGLNFKVGEGFSFHIDTTFFDALRKSASGKDYEIVFKWKPPTMYEGVIFNYGDKEPKP